MFALAACGPQLHVSSVDPETQPYLDHITSNLQALGYEGLIVAHKDGVAIVADNALIAERNDVAQSQAFYSARRNLIALPSGDPDKGKVRLMLAHELGHAFGLPHSDHGLMMPDKYPDYCYGSNAAICLIEALRDGGKL